jgi:hypothetical protein
MIAPSDCLSIGGERAWFTLARCAQAFRDSAAIAFAI